MVKANAYGHGVKDCLVALKSTDAFGVACLEEALVPWSISTSHHTGLKGFFLKMKCTWSLNKKIECVIHHAQQVEWLQAHKAAYIGQGLKVWVKLNSV